MRGLGGGGQSGEDKGGGGDDGWVPHVSIWRVDFSQSIGFHQLFTSYLILEKLVL
jgi:hypothetical protein